MPDFDLSLVVRGKDEGASATGQKVAAAYERLVAAEERVALAGAKAKVASDNLKTSFSSQQAAILRLTQLEERLAVTEANSASKAVMMGTALRANKANLANFGQQIQDVTQQAALGINPFTILIQQGGQLAYSLAGVGGAAGRIATFFAGPFGSILIATAGILGMLALRGHEAAKSQEDLGDMADYVGRAQSQLGKVIDLVTGKFTNQNEVLREAIRLQAILAQQEAYKKGQEAGAALARAGGLTAAPGPSGGPVAGALGAYRQLFGKGIPQDYSRLVSDYRSNANASFTEFRQSLESMAAAGKLKGIDVNAALVDALKVAVARGEYQANKDVQAVLEGREALPDYLRKTAKEKKPKKPKKEKDPFGVDEFGRDAANRIRDLAGAFADTPAQVERVNKAVAQLDDLIDDIRHKKPPNMKELLADAERARAVIQDGINKPFNDFILEQQKSLDVAKLITAGRYDEAAALRIVQRMEESLGPLTLARKDAVLATVQALRMEQRAADLAREKQQKYLDQLAEVKDAFHEIFVDPLKGIEELPKRLIGAAARLKGEKLFEQLLGPTFRELEDRLNGVKTADEAAGKMAVAVDQAAAANRRATAAVNDMTSAAGKAARALKGVDPNAPAEGIPGAPPALGDEIVITGRRPTDLPGILEKIAKGVGISDEGAKKIGAITGKAVGGAATGALTDQFLKPLGKALGFKTSATGAQIGGAIGAFLPIPGGDIIGSIVGSVVGGLFKKVPQGRATITNVYDAPDLSGNDKTARNNAGVLAETIQGGLLQIAEALGGSVGAFNVTVGQRHGDWRVNPSGTSLKVKRGAVDFNEDQAAAIAFAIADAIKDGAVSGLSDAVKKALGRYEDVDRSLREALKVQQLEDLIGGVGGSLTRVFKQFDTEAAERVRLAKDYGLDLLAVEKINGEQRTKLVDDLLKQRLGALEDLQKNLLYGDLFEGDAATRRSALLGEIGKVTKDAEAGIEGATDELADLYRQLVGTSREAYGTAGPEYAADRDVVISGLDHIIATERDRIEKAAAYQDATLAAANTNNALTNETNDLLAVANSQLGFISAALGGGSGGSGGSRLSTGRAVNL